MLVATTTDLVETENATPGNVTPDGDNGTTSYMQTPAAPEGIQQGKLGAASLICTGSQYYIYWDRVSVLHLLGLTNRHITKRNLKQSKCKIFWGERACM